MKETSAGPNSDGERPVKLASAWMKKLEGGGGLELGDSGGGEVRIGGAEGGRGGGGE
jgi:hypothetical protein